MPSVKSSYLNILNTFTGTFLCAIPKCYCTKTDEFHNRYKFVSNSRHGDRHAIRASSDGLMWEGPNSINREGPDATVLQLPKDVYPILIGHWGQYCSKLLGTLFKNALILRVFGDCIPLPREKLIFFQNLNFIYFYFNRNICDSCFVFMLYKTISGVHLLIFRPYYNMAFISPAQYFHHTKWLYTGL